MNSGRNPFNLNKMQSLIFFNVSSEDKDIPWRPLQPAKAYLTLGQGHQGPASVGRIQKESRHLCSTSDERGS